MPTGTAIELGVFLLLPLTLTVTFYATRATVEIPLAQLQLQWGHLDCFICGSTQTIHELDRFSCLPYVNWIVRCRPSSNNPDPANPTKFIYWIQRVEYVGERRGKPIFEPIGKPIPTPINGAKERPELGVRYKEDGVEHYNRYFDLYNSKSAPQMVTMAKSLLGD